jgi:hypothetical protein
MTPTPDAPFPPVTAALVIRPGDVLVVTMSVDLLSAEQAAQIRGQLISRLPGLADVVIVTHASALAVYRKGDDDA